MPSDYESFGMVALEAMASGTPVIASEVGGLAFLVDDETTGYLVPAREPGQLAGRIQTLVRDDAVRQQMGDEAARRAGGYAWPTIADRLLTIFEDILAQRRAHQTA
jgi:D-inositol-3-phosphate glycosyltransferase